MPIQDFVGAIVRLLFCDIPYVGYLLCIDSRNNAVLTHCMMFTNITLCINGKINTTDQRVNLVRLPIQNIYWIAFYYQELFQSRIEFATCSERNFGNLFTIHHCIFCFKPYLMLPCIGEGAATFTLTGNLAVVLPNDGILLQEFIQNLRNNCEGCVGGNLTRINNGRDGFGAAGGHYMALGVSVNQGVPPQDPGAFQTLNLAGPSQPSTSNHVHHSSPSAVRNNVRFEPRSLGAQNRPLDLTFRQDSDVEDDSDDEEMDPESLSNQNSYSSSE